MKYALIIGSNKYDDPKLAQLKTPAADSQALAKVLGDARIGAFDEVTPLINQNESQIRRSISSFLINKKPDDLVMLYFSGHGVLDDRGRLYLALRDTQVNLLKATSIPSSFLADEMDSCRSKRQILVLDCCHSGAFERGTKGDQKAITETTFEGSGFGRVVLTASDSTQYALEGDQVIKQTELSLFTHFLLEGLKTGEADTNNDGLISLDEWYDYTYTKVISETPRQVPHKWSYNQQGDLVIAKNPFLKKRVVELPYELLQALDSSFVGIRESAVNELGKYLQSRDAEMAQLAKSSLEKMKADDSRRISLQAEKLLADFAQAQAPAVKVGPPTSKPEIASVMKAATALDAELLSSLERHTRAESASQMHSSRPKAETPTAPHEFVFNRSFWLKWIGFTVLGIVIASPIVIYLQSYLSISSIPTLFGIVTAITSLLQWFVFRDHLKGWWVLGNILIGALFGLLHEYMFSNSGWGTWGIQVMQLYWLLGNLALGPYLLRNTQEKFRNASVLLQSGARKNIFLLLVAISAILTAISSTLFAWDISNGQDFFWALYTLSAIAAGITFFTRKDIPRNPGFIALALFLLSDAIIVALIVLDLTYQLYYFALSGIMAWASAIFFVSHKETWKNIGFLLLSGYLLFNGLASVTAVSTEIQRPFVILSAVFAVATALALFLRKQ